MHHVGAYNLGTPPKKLPPPQTPSRPYSLSGPPATASQGGLHVRTKDPPPILAPALPQWFATSRQFVQICLKKTQASVHTKKY